GRLKARVTNAYCRERDARSTAGSCAGLPRADDQVVCAREADAASVDHCRLEIGNPAGRVGQDGVGQGQRRCLASAVAQVEDPPTLASGVAREGAAGNCEGAVVVEEAAAQPLTSSGASGGKGTAAAGTAALCRVLRESAIGDNDGAAFIE